MRISRRVVLLTLVLPGLVWASWYGVQVWRFNRAFAEAGRALMEYDFPRTRQKLQECARLRPQSPEVALLAAQADRRDGQLDAAEAHFAHYRKLVGETTTPEGLLEETLLRTVRGPIEKDVEYLIALADRREPRHPASEQILEALAVGSNHLYQLERTRFWIDQLLTHYPRNPIGRLLRAQLDSTLGKRDRAEEEMRAILVDFPAFDKARLFLASLLSRRQKYEEALEQFQLLHISRPEDVVVLLGVVGCLERLGRLDEARPLVRELEGCHAENSEALLHAGRFAIREQRWPDAERLLSRAIEISPYDYEIHKELAVCLYQLGRSDEAQQHAERSRAIEADRARLEGILAEVVKAPRDPGPRVEAGRICLKNGQTGEGLRWLIGALEIAPDHKPTHSALADYYDGAGDKERARYHRALAQ